MKKALFIQIAICVCATDPDEKDSYLCVLFKDVSQPLLCFGRFILWRTVVWTTFVNPTWQCLEICNWMCKLISSNFSGKPPVALCVQAEKLMWFCIVLRHVINLNNLNEKVTLHGQSLPVNDPCPVSHNTDIDENLNEDKKARLLLQWRDRITAAPCRRTRRSALGSQSEEPGRRRTRSDARGSSAQSLALHEHWGILSFLFQFPTIHFCSKKTSVSRFRALLTLELKARRSSVLLLMAMMTCVMDDGKKMSHWDTRGVSSHGLFRMP